MNVRTALAGVLLVACKTDDPTGSPDGPLVSDAPLTDAPTDGPLADGNPACLPMLTDYQPRDMMSANDMWPACVSDQDSYAVLNSSVSTIARVAAFEQIAPMLFTAEAPSQSAFTDALAIYLQPNGLESRVSRREDEHYPPATSGGSPVACNTFTMNEWDNFPERCIGPRTLLPLIRTDGFSVGATSADPDLRRLAAARIEAGLLYFLYLSIYKEAVTCKTAPADCDSSWAYYGGGEQRAGGLGLARYVRRLDPLTHDRVFDGILAIRCWRHLDDPLVATDDAMFESWRVRGLAQLDRAALHAVALIVRSRVVTMASASGIDAAVAWELIRHLGPALFREAAARDAGRAVVLSAELEKSDAAQVDTSAILNSIDAIFSCP